MTHIYRGLFSLVLLFVAANVSHAAESGEDVDPLHHVSDGFYLDLQPLTKVELPRLFLVRNDDGGIGFDAFLSTTSAIESGQYQIVTTPEEGSTVTNTHLDLQAENPAEQALAADAAGHGGSGGHLEAELQPVGGTILVDFSITRHLVFAVLGGLIVILIFTNLARRYKAGVGRTSAPRGVMQNLMETLIVFVRDEIAKPNLGDKYGRFLPYLLTAFFFILTCNLLGLVPFGATATSNLMITAVLAAITFFITQLSASRDHWMHILWPPGVPTFVKPILIPVEILGLFTKPFALAIRLFANLTAGHLVILSLIGLIFSFGQMFGSGWGYGVAPVSIAFSLFIYLLELLVAFIQAYIFTMLSALFIGMAIAEHGHEHDDEYTEGVLPEFSIDDHSQVTPHPLRPQAQLEATH